MRKIFYSLSIISFLALSIQSCGSSEAPKDEWYVGGTLHQKTLRDWRFSTDKNKLATCADFLSNTKDYNGDMIQLKVDAQNLVDCIDESANDKSLGDIKITEVAAGCTVLMN